MKNLFLLFFVFCIVFSTQGQKNAKAIKVTYLRSSNDKPIENQDPILLFASEKSSLITSEKIILKKANFPMEQTFVDSQSKYTTQFAQFKNGKSILTIDSLALAKQTFELTNDTKKILGYSCKKAKTTVNSNSIELWYTNDLNIKGAPTVLGHDLGLVLEMVRNGNSKITATKIELLKSTPALFAAPNT